MEIRRKRKRKVAVERNKVDIIGYGEEISDNFCVPQDSLNLIEFKT